MDRIHRSRLRDCLRQILLDGKDFLKDNLFDSNSFWCLPVHGPLLDQEVCWKQFPGQHQGNDFARNLFWTLHGQCFAIHLILLHGWKLDLSWNHLYLRIPIASRSLHHLLGPGKEERAKTSPLEWKTTYKSCQRRRWPGKAARNYAARQEIGTS